MVERKQRKKDNFDWQHERVRALFDFLDRNVKWNKEFQEREYSRCLAGCVSSRDRLIHFLHLNVNTQSSADMDNLKPFWEVLYGARVEEISTLKAFISHIEKMNRAEKARKAKVLAPDTDEWGRLFNVLVAYPGWGVKTAALFVKATIKLHRGSSDMHFWPDATPKNAPLSSRPFLPVDRVILQIFRSLGHSCPNIENINNRMRQEYSAEQMLTWDDLWFWGFFTQTGSGNDRIIGWNSGKFWNQLSSSKADEATLIELANEFVQLL